MSTAENYKKVKIKPVIQVNRRMAVGPRYWARGGISASETDEDVKRNNKDEHLEK
jgi:hypothetical protein